MKKIGSQIVIALVCALLGFMLAYQFKMLSKQDKEINADQNSTEIMAQIESLKNEKSNLMKKVSELQNKNKKYEDAAASRDEITKQIKKELDDTRILSGSVDVHGPGTIVYIDPKSNFLSGNMDFQPINDKDIVDIVNELNSAGAEAVSINDIRLTARTGIRNAGNSILINEIKISPWARITIKAIGDKGLLDAALNFPGAVPVLSGYDITIQKSDDIKVSMNNKVFKYDYAKPVK